jgi:putative CocE/NonD family hydrolase
MQRFRGSGEDPRDRTRVSNRRSLVGDVHTRALCEYNLRVRMRDGVCLATDVYRPDRDGRYPVILIRTPYDKYATAVRYERYAFDTFRFVRDGHVVVVQDCRGTFASEGRFRPFHDETSDGTTTISWITAQPWSNGKVIAAGASYYGATQLLAAVARPSGLCGVMPVVTSSEYYEGWAYQNGAFQLGFALSWAVDLAIAELSRGDKLGDGAGEQREALEAIAADPWGGYRTLPLAQLAEDIPLLASYREWLAHSCRDSYWRATAINERYDALSVPGLHVGGWNDIFLTGTLENFAGMSGTGHSQHLIVGPWGHAPWGELVGDVWLGSEAGAQGIDDVATRMRTFVGYCERGGGAESGLPPVRLFVMGDNRWRDEDGWPLSRTVPTRHYLRDAWRLTREPPGDERPDVYRYDPLDPVPTIGGKTILPGDGRFMGPRDRRAVHQREDVLLYVSEPLQRTVEITGPVVASLSVATSAVDTDFTVGLVDVAPDGRRIGVTDGILRLRFRDGTGLEHLAVPGEVYRIEVDLGATSSVVGAGHRLALEVSSSNFPRFDRNPNSGGPFEHARAADCRAARQTIFHDVGRPSYVVLPMIER